MTKADYQRRIWTYRERRERLKAKSRNLTKKISQWQNQIRRIDYKKDELKKLVKEVNKYFQVDISKKSFLPEYNLARNIYYKIAIESKIQGKVVSEFIGRSKKIAGECRLSFTRSFGKFPKRKKAYHSFKKYFENE